MFRLESLEEIRSLERFLHFGNQENNSSLQENIPKENLLTKVKDYFTGNSNIWYAYQENSKTGEMEYSYPRSFSEDISNLKNYFTNLFSRKKI